MGFNSGFKGLNVPCFSVFVRYLALNYYLYVTV